MQYSVFCSVKTAKTPLSPLEWAGLLRGRRRISSHAQKAPARGGLNKRRWQPETFEMSASDKADYIASINRPSSNFRNKGINPCLPLLMRDLIISTSGRPFPPAPRPEQRQFSNASSNGAILLDNELIEGDFTGEPSQSGRLNRIA